MIRSRLFRLAVAGGVVAGGLAVAAPAANATPLAQTLVNCGTGGVVVSSLNPTLGSGDAKYVKTAIKRSDGTVHASLTGAEDLGPAPADATSCAVDAGIRTNNTATDVGTKLNPYDNQTNGQATLTMAGALAKQSGAIAGSASCNRADPSLVDTYPRAYPLNGKIVWKFDQLDAASHQIQIQQYVRLGTDPLDTDPTHITVSGIVIKGPGVGGQVDATLAFGASFSTKNVNLLDCVANPAAKNASLAQLIIKAADGTDAGTGLDPWLITIPS